MRILSAIFRKFGLYRLGVPPGHFGSPIPDFKDVIKRRDGLFDKKRNIFGVNINAEGQNKLLSNIEELIRDFPFDANKSKGFRYYYDNSFFQKMDAMILFGILKKNKPEKVIEVGSGFSSALLLDINEFCLDSKINLTFIEPYPNRLYSLLNKEDRESVNIIVDKIQNVDLELFSELGNNDILFLDTSHIMKMGSDISHWLFEILPRLQKGAIIHIHDIHYPFEYPFSHALRQKCYNEAYFIHSFLMYNNTFEIMLFNSWVCEFKQEWVQKHIGQNDNSCGSSLWLRKIA